MHLCRQSCREWPSPACSPGCTHPITPPHHHIITSASSSFPSSRFLTRQNKREGRGGRQRDARGVDESRQRGVDETRQVGKDHATSQAGLGLGLGLGFRTKLGNDHHNSATASPQHRHIIATSYAQLHAQHVPPKTKNPKPPLAHMVMWRSGVPLRCRVSGLGARV